MIDLGISDWEKGILIEPRGTRTFESLQTFNTAATVIGSKFHFVYRAIGDDMISRFGYANSLDGVHLDERLDHPVYQYNPQHPSYYSYLSGGGLGGIEDPRVTKMDRSVYVTYTVADGGGLGVAMTSLDVDDFLNKDWSRASVRAMSPSSEVHKNWVLFSEKVNGRYALLHSITPSLLIEYFDDLEWEGASFVRSYHNGVPSGHWVGGWEGRVRGIGPPPLKTKIGWLAFYHALPISNPDSYCIGAMLLDLDDPTKVLCRAKEPVITPWDVGDVVKQNIVYACGAVLTEGRLFLYYGAGDTKVHFAHTDSREFLESLIDSGRSGSGLNLAEPESKPIETLAIAGGRLPGKSPRKRATTKRSSTKKRTRRKDRGKRRKPASQGVKNTRKTRASGL